MRVCVCVCVSEIKSVSVYCILPGVLSFQQVRFSLSNAAEPVCAAALRPLGFWSSRRGWMRIANVHQKHHVSLFQSRVWRLRVFPSGVLNLWGCWQPSQTLFYPFPPSFNSVYLCTCSCPSSQFSSRLLLPGGTGSPSIWTALFFPTRLTLPLLHNPINLVAMQEYLIKVLLFYSPTKSHLAWTFPPVFNVYSCIQRPHGLLPLKAVYGLFVRQLKRSQFLCHRKEH